MALWLGAELESSFEKILNSLGEVPFFFSLLKLKCHLGRRRLWIGSLRVSGGRSTGGLCVVVWGLLMMLSN